jgi:hypothetical protein
VACTEYLTLMHVGGRSGEDIDAGGVLAEFTGTLMRDGYTGYAHLPAVHAWCAAHYPDLIRATGLAIVILGSGSRRWVSTPLTRTLSPFRRPCPRWWSGRQDR